VGRRRNAGGGEGAWRGGPPAAWPEGPGGPLGGAAAAAGAPVSRSRADRRSAAGGGGPRPPPHRPAGHGRPRYNRACRSYFSPWAVLLGPASRAAGRTGVRGDGVRAPPELPASKSMVRAANQKTGFQVRVCRHGRGRPPAVGNLARLGTRGSSAGPASPTNPLELSAGI